MRIPIISAALEKRETALINKIENLPQPKLSGKGEKFYDILGAILDVPEIGLSSDTKISGKILKANKEWVYRNNDVIAMEVSKMEFELYSVGVSGGEIVYNEVISHPLLDLLDKPNPETVKSDAVYIIQSHKKLTGDAFWLKIRNGRTVTALRSLPPDKITLILDNPTADNQTIIKGYQYTDQINSQYVDITYDPQDIIHLKKPNPDNLFRGLGVVEAFADTIDTDNLTNYTTKSFFKRGAITNFVLTTDQKIQDDQLKRIQAEMKQMYSGATNAYRTMILGGGLKPEKLTFSNKDMEFLDQLTWHRNKIMSGFGNTLASLGMLDDVNRATHESSMIEWKRTTIKPDMDAIVNSLNEFLVPEFGNNLLLAYKDPVPEDRDDDITEATSLYDGGIIMLNEARELLDYESVPDGDEFKQSNLVVMQPDKLGADNDEDIDQEVENIKDDEGEGKKAIKHYKLGRRSRRPNEVPKSLRHIEVKALLRRRGVYLRLKQNKELKDALKPLIGKIIDEYQKRGQKISAVKAAEILASRNKSDGYQPPAHTKFGSDEIMDYYQKQIHSIEVVEDHFDKAIIKFLVYVNAKIVDKLEAEIEAQKSLKAKRLAYKKWSTKDVFDDNEADFEAQAQLDFTPLLDNLGVIAGQDAYKLVSINDPYLQSRALKSLISNNVTKFTKSMLETDRSHISDIITNGIEQGQSVVDIRNALTSDETLSFTKMQSTRITRTEVSRTSIQSSIDAWQQSGVVEGVQWITAGADDECADYEGQIESLDGNFYSDTTEFADGDPPLHPNCRCSLIPIVIGGEERFVNHDMYKKRISELEARLDKRTKGYKELKTEKVDDKVYIKSLEKYLGISDEQV